MRSQINIPFIESIMRYGSPLMHDKSFHLPSDTPFVNLNLKWGEITLRIESVNRLIENLFIGFHNPPKMPNAPEGALDPIEHYQQKFNTENIFYSLRKTADELIGILYVLHYKSIHEKYPDTIKIDSIGKFLNTTNPFEGVLEGQRSFLRQLNDISNCYKHSFLNSEINSFYGIDFPVVFALHLPHNDFTKYPKPDFHTLDFRKVIKDYEAFLSGVIESIKSTYLKK